MIDFGESLNALPNKKQFTSMKNLTIYEKIDLHWAEMNVQNAMNALCVDSIEELKKELLAYLRDVERIEKFKGEI